MKSMRISNGIYAVLVLAFVLLIAFMVRPPKRDFTYRENQAYYITIDADGKLWLGDLPNHKAVPLYNDRGEQLGR